MAGSISTEEYLKLVGELEDRRDKRERASVILTALMIMRRYGITLFEFTESDLDAVIADSLAPDALVEYEDGGLMAFNLPLAVESIEPTGSTSDAPAGATEIPAGVELEKLRNMVYTREGVMAMLKKHWPDIHLKVHHDI